MRKQVEEAEKRLAAEEEKRRANEPLPSSTSREPQQQLALSLETQQHLDKFKEKPDQSDQEEDDDDEWKTNDDDWKDT